MKTVFGLGVFFLFVIGLIARPLMGGFVLMKLWNWYVIPFQVEGMWMTYPTGVGLMVIAGLVTIKTADKTNMDSEEALNDLAYKIGQYIAVVWLMFIIGWFLKVILM